MLARLFHDVLHFLESDEGPTAVEYAIMMALIIVVCIVSITALGSSSNKTYSTVGSTLGKTSS